MHCLLLQTLKINVTLINRYLNDFMQDCLNCVLLFNVPQEHYYYDQTRTGLIKCVRDQ